VETIETDGIFQKLASCNNHADDSILTIDEEEFENVEEVRDSKI
jgi:hypothetical protein